jgi:AraC-like DNA-binding protein
MSINDQYPRQYLYKRIVQAKLFIDERFQDPIDLDVIASEACFSKFHFIRAFRSVIGVTPHQYLTRVRMSEAARWLRRGTTVGDACLSVGFDSIGSFTPLFKRYFGLSPSVYRQLHIERDRSMRSAPLSFVPACFAVGHGWLE